MSEHEYIKRLYFAHYNELCRYVVFLIRQSNEAEDIVQKVFLKLMEAGNNLSEVQNPRAYLFTMVRNEVYSSKNLSSIQFDDEHDTDVEPEVLAQLAYKDTSEKLAYWVQQLPPRRKYIFELSRQQGLSHKAISDLLEVSPKTVENQIGKALKFLKDKIFDTDNQ